MHRVSRTAIEENTKLNLSRLISSEIGENFVKKKQNHQQWHQQNYQILSGSLTISLRVVLQSSRPTQLLNRSLVVLLLYSMFFADLSDFRQLWLQHMDSFAEYLFNIPQEVDEPTRVAVIDDGFDGFQEDYTENVVSGVSFCRYSDTHSLMNAYYVPSGRHGTLMASLICRVYPLAKLYIARLDEFTTSGGKRCITAQSAAEVREARSNDLDGQVYADRSKSRQSGGQL